MARIEFHILSTSGDDAKLRHACQVVEQLHQQQKPVFVYVDSEATAQKFDEVLWSFRDQAFIPHEVCTMQSPTHPRISVLIGTGTIPTAFKPVLINLTDTAPPQSDNTSHMIEIVDASATHKQLARERYKQYRDQGHQLETINH